MEVSNQERFFWDSAIKASNARPNSVKDDSVPKAPNLGEGNTFHPFGTDGLSFSDLIDMVNPLHHLPIINNVYQNITGDKIDPVPRIAGGSLFFGPIGFIGAAINIVVQTATGKDINGHLNTVFKQKETSENKNTLAKLELEKLQQLNSPVTQWAKKEATYRQELAEKFSVSKNNNKLDIFISHYNTLPSQKKFIDLKI